MPDDALFPPGPGGPPPAEAAAATAADTRSASDVRIAALELKFDQHSTGVAGAFDKIASFLNERLPSPVQRRDDSRSGAADEITTRILTDPRAVLDEHFMAKAKQTLGPALNVVIDGQHDIILRDLSTQFDADHGDGSFDKLIREDYTAALEKLPYEARANRATLDALVNGIRGSTKKFEEAAAAYGETKKRRTAERDSPPALIAGSRTPPSSTRLSDEERTFLADYAKRTGATDVSEKSLLEVRKSRDPRAGWSDDTFPRLVPAKKEAAA
jgi:hypothetical protein